MSKSVVCHVCRLNAGLEFEYITQIATVWQVASYDIVDNDSIKFRIINVYHDVPRPGSRPRHALQHMYDHELDLHLPTLLLGDFNTHARLWSLTGRTPSSWANTFTEWMGDNGVSCINPPDVPTWKTDNARPSVIDLALANEPALISAQLGEVRVSWEDSLGSDHAALSLTIHPVTSLTIIPPPTPLGYHAEDKHKDSWTKEFTMLLPQGLPYVPSHSTVPPDQESMPKRWSAIAIVVQESLQKFNYTIE